MKRTAFWLVTDTHYFEPSLGAYGKSLDDYMKRELYFLKESSAIVHSVFERIARDEEIDTVIIPGDLTKNGEKESHLSFIKELEALKAAEKKVFVITAGHDYNENPRAYRGDDCVTVEGTDFNELYELYRDFGIGNALAVDEPTHSYIAEISEGVRMLALNCDSPANAKGAIDERLSEWAKIQLDRAKAENAFVFAICHYPIIPSVPIFDLVGDAKVKNWRDTAAFLADNGVSVVFTGHMHIQSINTFEAPSGNRLVDICTSVLVGSPAKYRKVTIDENSVLTVESIPTGDFGGEMNGLTAEEFFNRQGEQAIINRINGLLSGSKPKELAGKIFRSIRLGTVAKLLFIRIDKSLKNEKLIDVVGRVGLSIFEGDSLYKAETPLYDAIEKALGRFNFILKKVSKKLSSDERTVDLKKMILDTVGADKEYPDNNAKIELNN